MTEDQEKLTGFISYEKYYIPETSQVKSVYDELSEHYEAAVQKVNENPQSKTLKLEALIKRQEIKKALERFDISGAFSEEEFHTDFGEYAQQRKSYETNEDGSLPEAAEDGKYTFLGVTLSNLAAVNSLGGHNTGDMALVEAVKTMESRLTAAGMDISHFKIYRRRSSDFVVRIDKANMSAEEFKHKEQAIITSMLPARLKTGDGVEAAYAGIRPRLVITEFDRSQAVDIFNTVQAGLKVKGKDILDFSTERDFSKFVSGLTVDVLEMRREKEFLYSLVEDMTNQLQANGPSDNLEKYYTLYVQRFFLNSNYKEFNDFVSSGKESTQEFYNKLRRELSDFCSRQAVERVLNDRQDKEAVARFLTRVALENLHGETLEIAESAIIESIKSPEPKSLPETTASKKDVLFNSSAKDISYEQMDTIYKTEGKKRLRELEKSFSDIDLILGDEELTAAEIISLQNSFTNLERLMEEYEFVNPQENIKLGEETINLTELLTGGPPWAKEVLDLTAKYYKEVVETTYMKHERLTGLNKREVFYREMDTRVYYALQNGKNMSFIFCDLSYLRYINDSGSRKIGDLAIEVTAASMEVGMAELLKQYPELDYVLSRYGGDEYTAIVDAEEKDMEAAMQQFEQAFTNHVTAYKLPKVEASKRGFMAQELRVNTGWCTLDVGIDALRRMSTNEDIFNEEDRLAIQETLRKYDAGALTTSTEQERANLMFFSRLLGRTMMRVSDRLMEYRKSRDRVGYIYGMYKRLKDNNVPESDESWETFRSILSYSQKALNDKGERDFEFVYNQAQGMNLSENPDDLETEKAMLMEYFSPETAVYTQERFQEEAVNEVIAGYIRGGRIRS